MLIRGNKTWKLCPLSLSLFFYSTPRFFSCSPLLCFLLSLSLSFSFILFYSLPRFLSFWPVFLSLLIPCSGFIPAPVIITKWNLIASQVDRYLSDGIGGVGFQNIGRQDSMSCHRHWRVPVTIVIFPVNFLVGFLVTSRCVAVIFLAARTLRGLTKLLYSSSHTCFRSKSLTHSFRRR